MATRSTISIENLDGSINTIYCHYDGYISHNGVILQTKYNDRELVAKLIMGGAISTLGSSISPVPLDFDEPTAYTKYYSYRGEITTIDYYKDFDDYDQNHHYEEFEYLFTKDNVWSVFFRGDWHDLEYVIQESEKEVA
jgi:hypothetical protein